MQKQRFIEWLNQELEKRGMKPADLAERGDISASTVSRLRSGDVSLTIEDCQAIAKGLGMSIEHVLIGAGVLSPPPSPVRDEDHLLNIYRRLSPQERQTVLQMLHGLREQSNGQVPDESNAIILHAKTVEQSLRMAPTADDVDRIQELLDSYRRHQVYDYALWQLRQQIISYNSSGQESMPEEWRHAIKVIDLLIATHKATPGTRREMAKLLEDGLESQSSRRADDESAGSLSLPPAIGL